MSEKLQDFGGRQLTGRTSSPRTPGSEADDSDLDESGLRRSLRARRRARINERREEAANVVQLSLPAMPQPDLNIQKKRNRWLMISALICIVLPVALTSVYYVFFAADQYASEARFAVRSNDSQAADVLGVFAGMPSTTVISDSYILSDYIRSEGMVRELEARIPLRAIYSRREGDFLTRLDPKVHIEDLVSYWQNRVRPVYDSTKNTITIEVSAFTPQDAATVVSAVVDISRNLVNNLSLEARKDAVKFASSEVERAEGRVREVRGDMLKFRTEHNEFDPTQSALASMGVASELDQEGAKLKSQLAAISGYLGPDAPSVQMLKSRIQALNKESANVQERVSSDDAAIVRPGSSGALAETLGEYQDLLVSQEFAEKAYAAAQGSLERARVEADRQQSYLALYVAPRPAEQAIYPTAMLNTLAVLVLSCLAWGLAALGFLTVRDHIV